MIFDVRPFSEVPRGPAKPYSVKEGERSPPSHTRPTTPHGLSLPLARTVPYKEGMPQLCLARECRGLKR